MIPVKVCPFCGADAKLKGGEDNDGYCRIPHWFVECGDCGARSKTFSEYNNSKTDCQAFALVNWNRRQIQKVKTT